MNHRARRLRFDKAEVELQGTDCRIDVSFTFGGKQFHAHATGENDPAGQLKTAAIATIDVIQQIAADRFQCSLADIDHVRALGKELIAVLVNVEFEGKQTQVFGSCQFVGNEIDVAVKATLNATNRLVELATRS